MKAFENAKKVVNFGEFWKTCTWWFNSVTRQVTFNRTKNYIVFENYSKCRIWIFLTLVFSVNFCRIKSCLSGNTVWPHFLAFSMNFCPLTVLNEIFSVIFQHSNKYWSILQFCTLLKIRTFASSSRSNKSQMVTLLCITTPIISVWVPNLFTRLPPDSLFPEGDCNQISISIF